jgi:hypothetical protein
MTALATVADLGVRLGLNLTGDDRAAALLDDVSANVVRYTGRDFTQHTSTVAVQVCCGKATLPHGPVISIASVTQDGSSIDYSWTSGRTITGLYGSLVIVTFAWGYAEVPADIIGLVCQVAGRAYGALPQDSSAPSESLGGWSTGAVPGAAAAGPFGLLAGERATLDSYRLKLPGSIRQDAWTS